MPSEETTPIRAWWTLATLVILYIVSMLDRQIIALLINQIKTTLQISDLQVSLVYGLAFAVFFCLAGLPIGYAIDRYARRPIIFAGVVVWSLATAGCGLATQYWHLAISRFVVGAGEAVLSPAAYSLLADTMPKRRLSLALGIFGIGGALGTGIALATGSYILSRLPAGGMSTPFGTFEPWQLTFILVAIPALLLAPLVFSFPEPERRGVIEVAKPGIRDTLAFICARKAFFLRFFVGNGVMVMCAYGFAAWVPTFLVRRFAVTMPVASSWVAGCALVAVPVGLLILGQIADRLFAHGHRDAHMKLFSVVGLIYAVAGPVMASAATPMVALAAIFVIFLFSGIAAIAAAVPLTTPNQFRGQVSSVYLLVTNLLGAGLGPTMVALFTDKYFHNDAMVGWSIAVVLCIFGPVSSILLLTARRPMLRAIDAAAEWSEPLPVPTR
ncbi:MFS transporter [Sphingomonas sp. 2378]|uniref:MFS transporter n=1 Tax=Sphingomonas sp. 2378 TaxID=1219748 RepID=UPI00311B2102